MSNTLFVGKVYHQYEELPSTNDLALELLNTSKTRPPEGSVIRAANQTAGRGQYGSRWDSVPGENLLLSVVFYPHWLPAREQFYWNMSVALALWAVPPVETPEIRLKWPNDLYLNGKKTAGVLIQNTLSGAHIQASVVGIGLNVNQLLFPSELPNATSLSLTYGRSFDLDLLAARLFEQLEQRYLQLKSGRREAIREEYESVLWRKGQVSRFRRAADGVEFEGSILGVLPSGHLRLEISGTERHFDLKELVFLP